MFTKSSTRGHCLGLAVGWRVSFPAMAICLLCCMFFVSVRGQSGMDHSAKTPSPPAPHRHDHDAAAPKEAAELATAARSGAPARRPGAVTIGDLQIAIPDVLVLDQNGKERRFYSDLIKDKVIVLSFFFTSCVSVCPVMSLKLTKLQANLAERLGKDVFIVTVTKDPETDTPPKLKAWGNNLGVKPGWTMVTGELKVLEKIVMDFTGDRLGKDSHNTVFLIGNDRTGSWTDISGYATPQELREQIDLLTKPVR
ncbi:MAG TPA: SCO family protein [Pyrinomonadaceae bacterium]|nr:SCO family protein [Pyrinomonadaceae bacterium]